MQKLIRYLLIALPFLGLAKTVLRDLDQNETGWDDEAANKIEEFTDWLGGWVEEQKKSFRVIARGLKEIVAYGNNVINSMKELPELKVTPPERLKMAKELQASLYDPDKVYQAERGKDAKALLQFKETAKNLIVPIKAQAEQWEKDHPARAAKESDPDDGNGPEMKEPETKEPETKEPETKEPETKEPETKKSESPESKKGPQAPPPLGKSGSKKGSKK